MAGSGPDKFDVYLRLAQIAALQSGFYLALGLILALLCSIWGLKLHLGLIFSSPTVDFSYSQGWTPAIAYLLACFPLTIAIYLCAGRARECLDFTVTVYILHLFAAIVYMYRFPTESAWWIVILISVISVSVGSEFLCIRREAIKKRNSNRDPIALSQIVTK